MIAQDRLVQEKKVEADLLIGYQYAVSKLCGYNREFVTSKVGMPPESSFT